MPTDNSTQAADASAHQTATDAQNAQAHSEPQKNEFNARLAFDATNKRLNDLTPAIEKLSKLDPDVISQMAEKLGIGKKESEKVESSPKVEDIVQKQIWLDKNSERIQSANKDGHYDRYVKQGLSEEYALRLAEQDAGIRIDTSEQKRQQKVSTADASIDRSVEPEMPESLKGLMTPEEFKKIAPKAAKVKVIQ